MSSLSDHTVLVCGTGSIGKRHARNLRSIGVEKIAVFDTDEAMRSEIAEELGCEAYADYEEALEAVQPTIVFVCSPTKFHVSQSLLAAQAGAHLFIEKPLNHTMEGIDELKKIVAERNLTCMVGCNMRFHHGPATVKKLLEDGAIGTVDSAEVTVAFSFTGRPDFANKVERYRHSYNADPSQGGAIRECIHEIDLALWYFGKGELTKATKEMATAIELPSVDGSGDLYIAHDSGANSHVHVSFMNPEYQRYCKISGENGSIEWHFGEDVVVRDANGDVISTHPEPESYEVNQMYIDEINSFFTCIENKKTPDGNLDDATYALGIALEALEKAEEKVGVAA